MMLYNPSENMICGFTQNDGSIDFYLRINSLVDKDSMVLDLGAGRAAWFEDDKCEVRKELRLLKGKVKKLIAADVDPAVFENRACDDHLLIDGDKLYLEENSIDLVVADYVLEHIENPDKLFEQINYCLRSGGWFCARTPHKYSYVALAASVIKNRYHAKWLSFTQPNRKEKDVFPTHYKLNELQKIKSTFLDWENYSFIYRAEPSYYFGSKMIFILQSFLHRLLPAFVSGNLFVFIRKP